MPRSSWPGQADTAQEGLAGIRTSLSRYVGPEVVTSATEAWLEQGARLVRVRRAVGLVEEALRGQVFVRRM